MIRLREMTEAEFVRCRTLDRENYAQSIAHVHRMPIDEARQEALKLGDDALRMGSGARETSSWLLWMGRRERWRVISGVR